MHNQIWAVIYNKVTVLLHNQNSCSMTTGYCKFAVHCTSEDISNAGWKVGAIKHIVKAHKLLTLKLLVQGQAMMHTKTGNLCSTKWRSGESGGVTG